MSKNLVIVESPAKARTIEKFLGKDFKVLASIGHIRDLPKSKIGVKPKEHFKPDYVIPTDKKKVVSELKKEAKKADKVYIATDDDREGEAIGWHLLYILGIKKDSDYERIVFHEITKKAIDEAIHNPRKIDDRLFHAQQARRILDRLVGYELSPILWAKVKSGLSAGRVQSVALRLIVEKEEEIQAFKPEEYWKVIAEVSKKGDKLKWEMLCDSVPGGKERSITSAKDFKEMYDEIEKKKLVISKAESKEVKKTPPPPFTTSSLQQAASSELGYGVKQTMMLAQKLYEGIDMGKDRHGLITYMRTDSTSLSPQAVGQMKKVIEKDYGKEYALAKPRFYKTKAKGAQEAHEAIRPVDFTKTPESIESHLEAREFKLYKLIYNRAMATQMQEAKVAVTSLVANPKGTKYDFTARGEQVLFDGWLKLGKPKKDVIFPALEEGEELDTSDYNGEQNFTKPPARYSEASLVKELEKRGIGRPSTYAPTIHTLHERAYVEKKEAENGSKSKFLVPTDIGILVIHFLKEHFAGVVDYDFTARIEEDLDDIADGSKVWDKVLKEIYDPFHKNIVEKKETIEKVVEKTDQKCPECGSDVVIKFGRYGKFMTCEKFPDCKYKAPMPEEAKEKEALEKKFGGEKCEKCGSKMTIKTSRFGNFLACENYPECKTTKSITEDTGVKCPMCKKGDLIGRNTRRGKQFWGCSAYPKCKFASWTKPSKDNLEELVEKFKDGANKKGK